MVVRDFNLRKSEARKMGKMGGLNQFLRYIHPSPPLSPEFFYAPLFKSLAKIKLFLGIKSIGGGAGVPRLPSQVTAMTEETSGLLATRCVPLL
jgi:hypothetical protein